MRPLTVEEVYKDFYEKVLWLVTRKVTDRDLAEDITSDVFLKIAKNLERFDSSKASIATWVYTIANRTLTDYYRTRRTFVKLPEENGEEGAFPSVLIDGTGVDADLLLEEQLHELTEALKRLPERERDLIILHYYEEVKLKDVAVRMGMSYANVKIIHKKALNRLKEYMMTA